jgi:hypothetical protein
MLPRAPSITDMRRCLVSEGCPYRSFGSAYAVFTRNFVLGTNFFTNHRCPVSSHCVSAAIRTFGVAHCFSAAIVAVPPVLRRFSAGLCSASVSVQ